LLIIAGPGSGKTFTLVVRTVNILLQNLARPREILLCTFTEKAAGELRDRLAGAVRTVGYTEDLSELLVGTIHGVCNEFIQVFRHHTYLSNNYEVLDDLTQRLFLFDRFDSVIGEEDGSEYLERWTTKWTAIDGALRYFNAITEELIDPCALMGSGDPFLQGLGRAYQSYEAALEGSNRIDFAHQQKLFHQLLDDPEVGPGVCERIKYVMVDEYQDSNFVQEQLVLRLAGDRRNLCVVGDDDQSLYRFRGATVRNILEFPGHFPDCAREKLVTNYRSHRRIVEAYNDFMDGADWSNPTGGNAFRYEKEIRPDPGGVFPEYPAVFSVWGENERDEGARVADLAAFLPTSTRIRRPTAISSSNTPALRYSERGGVSS
jgi:DNA helicase-2/ATP-dependent DNA helicase PcrA